MTVPYKCRTNQKKNSVRSVSNAVLVRSEAGSLDCYDRGCIICKTLIIT